MVKKYLAYLPFNIMTNLYLTLKRNAISLIYILRNSARLVKKRKLPSVVTVHTESLLKSFHFSADSVVDIIKKLDPSKAHGHDMVAKCMFKLCGDFILNSLEMFFKNFLEEGISLDEWKKANVVPIHKK